MDIEDEPNLEVCILCSSTFWSDAYSGGTDVCPNCFYLNEQEEQE